MAGKRTRRSGGRSAASDWAPAVIADFHFRISRRDLCRQDLDRVFADVEQQRPDALIRCGGSGLLTALRPVLDENVMRMKIAMSVPGPLRIPTPGALVGYGPNLLAGFRLAATYV